MSLNEKTITSEIKFEGKIINVRVEDVELQNGKVGYREFVDHPGGVGIVAITSDNKILMVKQYRKAVEKELLEIPAGKLEKGEDPLVCGKRELEEETGYKAKEFVSLGYLYPSPGFANETTHLYLAWDLYKGKVNPDEDEFLDIFEISVEEIYSLIMKNEINDAKTIIGFFKAMEYIKNN
ncbi:MAG: NUDIX hydrolase [Clostridia bacterium]|nr:NUDIX hydrolase [Clostridia bacterium]